MTKRFRLSMDGLRGRDGHAYYPGEALEEAASVAMALEVPLLMTGEPGCGKTDFAFALARKLADNPESWTADHEDNGLLQSYVRSDTTAKDLLYHYDAVRRFGEAHHGNEGERMLAGDARNYVELMSLGHALASSTRRVLLIDEIDKAPRDLPNDLLRELDQGQFEIAEIAEDADRKYGVKSSLPARKMGFRLGGLGAPKPIIIITSNEERQLPGAFLRRCAFCHIDFPSDEELVRIVEARFSDSNPELTANDSSKLITNFVALRKLSGLVKKPGTAELLAWVDALLNVLPQTHLPRALAFVPKESKWTELPGRSCLIKMREDEARLRR